MADSLAAARRYPTASRLADTADPSLLPWAVPPPLSEREQLDHAAHLLRQARVADVVSAAVDTGCATGRLTVAFARLAVDVAHQVIPRGPWP